MTCCWPPFLKETACPRPLLGLAGALSARGEWSAQANESRPPKSIGSHTRASATSGSRARMLMRDKSRPSAGAAANYADSRGSQSKAPDPFIRYLTLDPGTSTRTPPKRHIPMGTDPLQADGSPLRPTVECSTAKQPSPGRARKISQRRHEGPVRYLDSLPNRLSNSANSAPPAP